MSPIAILIMTSFATELATPLNGHMYVRTDTLLRLIYKDYVAAATAAEVQILFELRPTISRLSQCVFFDISKTAYDRQLVLLAENEKRKMKNTHSVENENG